MKKFMDFIKKSILNVSRDMLGCEKFLKDTVSHKRKLGKFETVNQSEECSAVLQKKLSLKQKDSVRFTIAYVIGG